MNIRKSILTVMNDNAPLNFEELFHLVEPITQQTRQVFGKSIWNIKSADLISLNTTTKRYEITEEGVAYLKQQDNPAPKSATTKTVRAKPATKKMVRQDTPSVKSIVDLAQTYLDNIILDEPQELTEVQLIMRVRDMARTIQEAN